MEKRGLLKTKGFYVVTFLFILFILHPLNLLGQQAEKPVKPPKVEVKDSLITVDVEDAEISDVLKAIEKGTGIKITIAKELIGEKVTASFQNLDVESALKDILRNQYYVLTFTQDPANKEKRIPKEVKAGGPAIGSKLLERTIITKEIPYGKGKEDVGSIDEGEGALTGPQSFAVSDKGEIYICDTVNKRVQIFLPNGGYLSTISLQKGTFAQDIAVDKSGFIYVYDRVKLYQYDRKGNIVTSVDVNESRWGGGGIMHIINNEIHIYACDSITCGDFIIGRIFFNNVLVGPSVEESKRFKEEGRQGLSGRKYMTRLKRFEEGKMEIKEKDGTTSKTVVFPLREIVSTEFLGEDSKGNAYVKTERNDENKELVVDVHEFDKNGNYLNTFRMPAGKFHFWSAKHVLVSKDGTIYYFRPEKDKLTINILPPGSNQ